MDKCRKRLLLNDPSVIVDRIARLESTVAYLNTTVKQQAETIENQKTTIQDQANKIKVLDANNNVAVTYTVWGRKQCPNNSTQLVYSGFAGGSFYSHSGAAVDYLCLPPDPNYRKTTYSGQYGRLYGAEYDSSFIANGDGNDVPCAVCRTSGASTILMIPGKDTCYGGWDTEYYGYLNAHDYNFAAATSYVCLHINPEFVTGGGHNYEGKLFHPVIGFCGALQCPPYVNNYPVTCVVCSK